MDKCKKSGSISFVLHWSVITIYMYPTLAPNSKDLNFSSIMSAGSLALQGCKSCNLTCTDGNEQEQSVNLYTGIYLIMLQQMDNLLLSCVGKH